MSDRTERVNALIETVKESIGDMDSGMLFDLLIHLPDVIAQRAYDIQCSADTTSEKTYAVYAKSVANEASNYAERFATDLERMPGS